MILLVDGYNVVKQALLSEHISSEEKKDFISMLGRYVKRRRHQLILFFDGGDSLYPFREHEHGIEIVHSGYNTCADSVIKDYVLKYKNHDTLLVTSDRELRSYAKKQDVESVNSLFFYDKVKDALDEVVHVKKKIMSEVSKMHSDQNDSEIDQLMMQASKNVVDKDFVLEQEELKNKPKRHKPQRTASSFTKDKKHRKKDKKLERL